jgi:vesicle transport through interaction with t-SNAREs protein 1
MAGVPTRSALLGNDRQRLTDASDRLEESSKRLEEARREITETEDIAMTTMRTLRGQTEQIQRTRGRLDDVDSNLSSARVLVTTMTRRAYQNKALLYCVSFSIAFVIILVLVRKITGFFCGVLNSDASNTSPFSQACLFD